MQRNDVNSEEPASNVNISLTLHLPTTDVPASSTYLKFTNVLQAAAPISLRMRQ